MQEQSEAENAPIELARTLVEKGEEQEAVVVLREPAEAGNVVAAIYLGALLFGQGDPEGAKKAFDQAESSRPESGGGWFDPLPFVKSLVAGDPEPRAKVAAGLKRGQDEGYGGAGITLGHLQDQGEGRGAGMATFRISAEAGDMLAAMKWFGLASSLGLTEEAERAEQVIEGITGEAIRRGPDAG